MWKLCLIYEESGKRYILDFSIVEKVFKLKPEDIKKLEAAVKKEIRKV